MAAPMAIAGGASLIGGLLQSQQQQSQSSAQMAFQERMSDTAYQRATADMRIAGINPILAYAQGGATTPGGAQASIPNVVGPAVSSAMDAQRLMKEMDMMDTQMKQIETQSNADVSRKKAAADLDRAQTNVVNNTEIMQRYRDIPAAANAGAVEGTRFGRIMPYVDRVLSGAKGPLIGGALTKLVGALPE